MPQNMKNQVPMNRNSSLIFLLSSIGLMSYGSVACQQIKSMGRLYSIAGSLDSSEVYSMLSIRNIVENAQEGRHYLVFEGTETIACIYELKESSLTGPFMMFHPAGGIWMFAEFSNAQKDCTQYYFDEEGRCTHVIYIVNGMREHEYSVDHSTGRTEHRNHTPKKGTVIRRIRKLSKHDRIVIDRIQLITRDILKEG